MIAGTLLVAQQLDYLRSRDLGLNIDQTLVVQGPTVLPDRDAIPQQMQAFRDAVQQVPGIQAVAQASTVPGKENFWIGSFRTERMEEADQKDIYIVSVDEAFMETFEVELLAGRFFSEAYGADEDAFILNETAARLLGYATPEEALQGRIQRNDTFLPVIGVIRDYHQNSLKEGLDPVLFQYRPTIRHYVALKVSSPHLDQILPAVEAVWKDVFPGNPYEYFFLDDFFNQQYQADRRFGRVFGLFAVLAIVVACLGLFGLASFSVQQRTKEIGIRKVLGASVPGIVGLLSREYAVLVVLANVIAWPVTYVMMSRWLETFAYHIEPGFFTLLLASVAALLIAVVTVSYNALRAAHANPVEALRYE